jgi:PAS domain S-box-containing protein
MITPKHLSAIPKVRGASVTGKTTDISAGFHDSPENPLNGKSGMSIQALLERAELFQSIAESSGDAIVTADSPGKTVYLNRAALVMFGYSADEVTGQPSSMLLARRVRAVSESALDRVNRTGVMKNMGRTIETVALKKDGTEFPIEFTITCHNTRGGRYFSFIIRDISERTRSRKALEKAYIAEKELREKLEEEARKRMDFSKALVHELKTPLTPVLASTELLLEEKLSETGLILVKNIQRGAANLNLRIDELLDLALGEVGQIELAYKAMDLPGSIRSVLDDSAASAYAKLISINFKPPSRFPLVEADEGRIRQVVRNLVNNAVRVVPEGSRIDLRLHREGGWAVIEVRDNGRGLAPEDQRHVFEAYRRPRDERRRLGGLGIGLAVARILVELHGGEVGVSSQLGTGSTFRFTLPFRRPKVEGADGTGESPREIVPAN